MKRLILSAALLVFFWAPASSFAQDEQVTTLAGRSVVYWQPTAQAAKAPVVLFSHGFLGCGTQSKFLTRALAQNGYWVFAPQHHDAACTGERRISEKKQENFMTPDQWDETSYVDRRDDMKAVWEALHTVPAFKDKIDFDKLGLAGHSLGGYTVLGLAGAWADWSLPGVKAVLAVSPYSAPYNIRDTIKNLTAPVMFQGGTNDILITRYTSRAGGSYDRAPMPKFFVNLQGANHFAWTDRMDTHHDLINAYAVAFFDHYLKGQGADALLTTKEQGVFALRYAAPDLGSADK